jgi:hypothetical protein
MVHDRHRGVSYAELNRRRRPSQAVPANPRRQRSALMRCAWRVAGISGDFPRALGVSRDGNGRFQLDESLGNELRPIIRTFVSPLRT